MNTKLVGDISYVFVKRKLAIYDVDTTTMFAKRMQMITEIVMVSQNVVRHKKLRTLKPNFVALPHSSFFIQ